MDPGEGSPGARAARSVPHQQRRAAGMGAGARGPLPAGADDGEPRRRGPRGGPGRGARARRHAPRRSRHEQGRSPRGGREAPGRSGGDRPRASSRAAPRARDARLDRPGRWNRSAPSAQPDRARRRRAADDAALLPAAAGGLRRNRRAAGLGALPAAQPVRAGPLAHALAAFVRPARYAGAFPARAPRSARCSPRATGGAAGDGVRLEEALMYVALVAVAGLAAGAALPLILWRWDRLAVVAGATVGAISCAAGLTSAIRAASGGAAAEWLGPWSLPIGALRLGLDPLSAVFLCCLFAVGLASSIYGAGYMLAFAAKRRVGWTAAALNALLASIALVFLARDGVLFLFGWEGMTVSAFLLIAFEHEHRDVREGALWYLVFSHFGVACLFAYFSLMGSAIGTFQIPGAATSFPPTVAAALLHVLSHSAFKSLLFSAAGAVLHGAHTRRLERMGGLLKRMPATAAIFLCGAAAAAAVPGLAGFASEFVVYRGLFDALGR